LLGADPERDVRDEVGFHLETEIEELIASGVAPDEARRLAVARFGDVEAAMAQCHESDRRRLERQRRGRALDALAQDLRYGVRSLAKQPAFTATVVLVLALGIGVNAAVFSLVDPLFFRMPAAVAAPREVKQIYVERQPTKGDRYFQARFSLPEARFIDSSIAAGGLRSAIVLRSDVAVEVGDGPARRAKTQWVSPRFLSVLGVQPVIGSDFDAESGRFGVPASTVMISWRFWQNELAGDPRALGRVIRVAGRPLVVRGITPRGFAGIDLDGADLWLPLGGFTGFSARPNGMPWYESWGTLAFRIVARAPDGGGEEQLVQSVDAGVRAAAAFIKENPRPGAGRAALVRVVPGSLLAARGPGEMTHGERIAALLGALSLLLLVLAAANACNMLLGRAVTREREISVRIALGISRRRLIGLLAIESLLLALLATIAAVVLAAWTGGLLRSMVLPGQQLQVGKLDYRVASLALVLGVGVALIASLVPMSSALRLDLVGAIKSTSRDGGGRHSRTRTLLVAVQAALSVTLLIGTGLAIQSLFNIRSVDLGLDVDRVITVARDDSAKGPTLDEIGRIARGLPGVTDVARSATVPLDEQFGARAFFDRNGDTLRLAGAGARGGSGIGFVAADPEYLRVVGTRVTRGRELRAADRFGSQPVMVVSEELARRAWPGKSPVGQCLRIERADSPCYTAVGVAENAHSYEVVEEPKAVFYIPFDQRPERSAGARALVIRTSKATRLVADRLRHIVGDTAMNANGDLVSARRRPVHIMSEMLASDYQPWEIGARLFAACAGLALLLALIGLYGVLSYVVALRRREIGVRMALGADRTRVMALIVGEGVKQVSLGIVAGVLLAMVFAARMSVLLYHVSPHDPVVIVVGVTTMLGCAALASAVPGRRAMAIDPLTAMRDD
jgi:predicted permease